MSGPELVWPVDRELTVAGFVVRPLERGIEGYRRVVADGWLRPIQRRATNHLPGGI